MTVARIDDDFPTMKGKNLTMMRSAIKQRTIETMETTTPMRSDPSARSLFVIGNTVWKNNTGNLCIRRIASVCCPTYVKNEVPFINIQETQMPTIDVTDDK